MEGFLDEKAKEYKRLLIEYIDAENEKSLYGVELVSKDFIKNKIFPEEIINLHIKALKELYPNLSYELERSLDFLLEAMISYGLSFREVQALREQQIAIKSEIAVAAKMQRTLLRTEKPEIAGLDMGVISVPAKQMNGDYYQIVENDDGSVGFAMADVIGKGIPAALCMSMIKYSMDSFPQSSMRPPAILTNLNRVVERNIEPNMFITMICAQYFPKTGNLIYSSAGHEPGFYYDAATDHFTEITTHGLVLGVTEETKYEERELIIKPNDLVILLTDGVTECRDGDRFIEIEEVLEVIKQYLHLSAQEMVDAVYKHFERFQDFQLQDDFSLLIFRKTV